MSKPYSESCDQNRDAILSVILPLFSSYSDVLEIGSGTGQHAVYFAEKMPHLTWYTSDCQPYLDGIRAWVSGAGLNNVRQPFELDVSETGWPVLKVDAIFTANSLHIMDQEDVEKLVQGAAALLGQDASLIIYGPFNYHGAYTSESNERFDRWLKERNSRSSIKHFEEVNLLARENGMKLVNDYEMPANNRILHFIKK